MAWGSIVAYFDTISIRTVVFSRAAIGHRFRYHRSYMEPAWTFHRGGQRLTLQRRETDEGLELLVTVDGALRTHRFFELAALVKFQSDTEQFLLKTGWSFEQFSPDRRTGRDCRTFPRVDADRRRWWTDGLRLFRISSPAHRRARQRRPSGHDEK